MFLTLSLWEVKVTILNKGNILVSFANRTSEWVKRWSKLTAIENVKK